MDEVRILHIYLFTYLLYSLDPSQRQDQLDVEIVNVTRIVLNSRYKNNNYID